MTPPPSVQSDYDLRFREFVYAVTLPDALPEGLIVEIRVPVADGPLTDQEAIERGKVAASHYKGDPT